MRAMLLRHIETLEVEVEYFENVFDDDWPEFFQRVDVRILNDRFAKPR